MNKKITQVNKLLVKKYGIPPRPENPPDPLEMLIATILSQNTNDKNSFKAYQNLKNNYKNWDQVASTALSQLEKSIKVAGLGKQKSKAIKDLLNSLLKEYGKITLNNVEEESNDFIISKLTGYKGVGVKTASCVLLFSLRRNVCPVDTHVHRTVNRIGIVEASTPDKTFYLLNSEFPKNIAHSFHTNLIRLGREICKPSQPQCFICPLQKICEYPDKNMAQSSAYKTNDFMLLDNIK